MSILLKFCRRKSTSQVSRPAGRQRLADVDIAGIEVVAASHDPDKLDKYSADAVFARCVGLASILAELSLDTGGARGFAELAQRAQAYFEIDKEGLGELLAEIGRMIPDAESVFETEILSAERSEAILAEAREALMLRNRAALRDVDQLKSSAETLEARTRRLEETRHDVGVRRDLSATISIDMVVHNDGRQFKSVEELVKTADKALYTAKLQGRNRSVPFDLVADSQLAYM